MKHGIVAGTCVQTHLNDTGKKLNTLLKLFSCTPIATIHSRKMITKLIPRAFVAVLAPEPALPTRAEKTQHVPQPLLEIIIDKCEKVFSGKRVPVRKVSFNPV
jgi:hypothetical protein